MTLDQLIEELQTQQRKGKGGAQVLYRVWSAWDEEPFEQIDEVSSYINEVGEEIITLL